MLALPKLRLKRANSRGLTVLILTLAAVFVFYFWHLATLTPGMSQQEVQAIDSARSWHSLLNNPVFLPHKVLQSVLLHAELNKIFWMRLVSVAFMLLFVWCFYKLAAAWFGRVIALFATLIFASTPLVIIVARSATADVLYLFPVALAGIYYWLFRTQKRTLAWFCLIAAAVASLYIPAGFVIVGGSFLLTRKRLMPIAKTISKTSLALSVVLGLVLLIPMGWAIAKEPALAKSFVPLPGHWQSVIYTVKSLLWTVPDLIWRTRQTNPFILERLPVLDIVQLTLFIFGIYAMLTRAKRQVVALLLIIIAGMGLAGLVYNFSLLLVCVGPISLIGAAGLRYLFLEWREIFPRNPLPKALALLVTAAVVAINVAYGLRYSLVAWPHSTATRQTYVIK